MSTTIEMEAGAAGLPPPLLLSATDATQLAFVLRGEATRPAAVGLISARNGEGTSTLARDICLVSAANGTRTLLLAAEGVGRSGDWARNVYGMPAGLRPEAAPPGTEMLALPGTALALAAPTGSVPPQVPAWLAILAQLRTVFDLIVVDAPALERAFTGVILAPHLDAVAMVVQAERTRANAARALRDRLAEAGAEIAGVILNKRRFHVPRAAYERL